MTQATELLRESRAPHLRLVGTICAAHFVSHYYILLLAPLLPFVRAEYGVSYTQIGLVLAVFNIVTTVLQTPVGFLVDWLSARVLLILGLMIGASAFVTVGLVDSFWVMMAMYALAGVGNTVYHPANYALLSQHVPPDRIGQAFSFHTFSGMLGAAVAPASLLLMQNLWGWRGAYIGAGILGFAVAAILLAFRENAATVAPAAPPRADADQSAVGWRLLLSPPILLNLLFFMLLATMSGGTYNYSVVALGALHGTPVTVGNFALSGYLLLSAIGVLIGGLLVGRTKRHDLVATLGLVTLGLIMALIGTVDLGVLLLIVVMSAGGFFSGLIMPSRDMIVRSVTPPGSFGKVFGFVTTGFNLGGIVSPLIFGAIMDHGSPRLVFLGIATFSLIAVISVATRPRRAV